MFRNVVPGGTEYAVVTVDEDRDATLVGLGGLGREWPGDAARLTWGERTIRVEYDVLLETEEETGRQFNWYFFLRQGVGEQYLTHANASTWPWYDAGLTEAEREQAWLLAMEALLVRETFFIPTHPAWIGVKRFRSGGREFRLEDFGYDAAMVEEANRR